MDGGKYGEKPWFGRVILSDYVMVMYDSLSPEEQEVYDEGIMEILCSPRGGEPARRCWRCDEYFFFSDCKCPDCGWRPLG